MKCGYSREILALYIENDLPSLHAIDKVKLHVNGCAECQEYCEQLQKNQLLIKSRFKSSCHAAVTAETLASIRRAVLSQIDDREQTTGWAVKLERWLMRGFRRQGYALAGFAVVAVVSASLMGQMRNSQPGPAAAAAVFVGKNTLVRPAGYREWVFAGSSLGPGYSQSPERPDRSEWLSSEMHHNVYIDPAAYREYARSGKFPEGTVMVREVVSAELKKEPGLQGSYEKDLVAVEVSVKDSSRFQEGWAYFDFTESMGTLKSEAEPIPESAGCVSCHREKAATDHVFTQFYPVLKSVRS